MEHESEILKWLQGWITHWVSAASSVRERLENVLGGHSAAASGHSLWAVQVRTGSTQLLIGVSFNTLGHDDSIWSTSNPDVESLVELVGISGAPSFPESELYLVFFLFIFRIY